MQGARLTHMRNTRIKAKGAAISDGEVVLLSGVKGEVK